jgi:hypothetical protein
VDQNKSDQSNIGGSSSLRPILDNSGQVKTWNQLTSDEQKSFGTQTSYDTIVKRYHDQQGSGQGGNQGGQSRA